MAITTDATTSGTATTGTTVSWSHTCAAAAVLYVSVGWQTGPSVASVTYNGVAMTSLWNLLDAGASINGTAGFILKNPATGANTILVTMTSAADLLTAAARSYLGVDTTTPNRTPVSAQDGAANTTTVVVSNAQSGDLVVDSATIFGNPLTVDASQSVIIQDDSIAGGNTSWGMSQKAASGSTTMHWTGTFSFWAAGGCALIPALAGSTATPAQGPVALTGQGTGLAFRILLPDEL